jgi:HD-like signal output (HDOD) protein
LPEEPRSSLSSKTADPKLVYEAFAAGMLHDTEKLILAFNFSRAYVEMLEQSEENPGTLLDIERKAFGATHAEVGGYLLGLWGLPVPVVEAIALHHSPALSTDKSFSPLTTVYVADGLAKSQKLKADLQEPSIDLTYLSELGLAERLDFWKEVLSGLEQRKHDEH